MLAPLANFAPSSWRYSLERPSWPPIELSSPLTIEPDVPARDSVSSSFSSWRSVPCRRMFAPETHSCDLQWLGQPISSQPSTLLPILPAAVCVSGWPASLALLVNVFRVAGFSFSTSSASCLSSSWRRTANVKIGFELMTKSRPCHVLLWQHPSMEGQMAAWVITARRIKPRAARLALGTLGKLSC